MIEKLGKWDFEEPPYCPSRKIKKSVYDCVIILKHQYHIYRFYYKKNRPSFYPKGLWRVFILVAVLFFVLSCICMCFVWWACVSVYDAFGKMGSNVEGGNANRPGLLQQCHSAHGPTFSGQYCQVFLRQVTTKHFITKDTISS